MLLLKHQAQESICHSLKQSIPREIKHPEGLFKNENHKVCRIGDTWFSYTQKGDAIMFHVFSEKPKYMTYECGHFIKWLFDHYKWCKMLLITVNKRSLIKLAEKHGFETQCIDGSMHLMTRYRQWDRH